ncbi:hypothetical protein BC937DRAFT_92022 [Endogone sp. FLAS-F59071]|nr:hypothetical protein BC937DRAFT_92022 [Endogone sp. FLAS-F59071]|eukprot:RUS21637.1 hypothetical protein BC937DRAFT_92022 [Endogone sp. FLAS-F59071]
MSILATQVTTPKNVPFQRRQHPNPTRLGHPGPADTPHQQTVASNFTQVVEDEMFYFGYYLKGNGIRYNIGVIHIDTFEPSSLSSAKYTFIQGIKAFLKLGIEEVVLDVQNNEGEFPNIIFCCYTMLSINTFEPSSLSSAKYTFIQGIKAFLKLGIEEVVLDVQNNEGEFPNIIFCCYTMLSIDTFEPSSLSSAKYTFIQGIKAFLKLGIEEVVLDVQNNEGEFPNIIFCCYTMLSVVIHKFC